MLKAIIYDLSRFFSRILIRIFFRGRWSGEENLPCTGGALVCSNHQSAIDPILVGAGVPRRMNYLARESLFRFKPFAWLIRCYNAIPIQREGIGIGGLKETLKRLKRGGMVLIFPEGTRTSDGSILPVKPGFCALVRRGKVPIIPVAMHGAFEAFPRHRMLPRLAKIGIHYGQPISVSEINSMQDDELMELLHNKLVQYHEIAKNLHHNQTQPQIHSQAVKQTADDSGKPI